MRKAFCTISTFSHLAQVRALHESLRPWLEGIEFVVLLVDKKVEDGDWEGIRVLQFGDLSREKWATEDIRKYRGDELRWALKPVLMQKLLAEGVEQVVYLDNDLFFFADPRILFDEMGDAKMLLSPHWRTLDPKADRHEFENHFMDGIYNAGMVGAAAGAEDALDWWAMACNHHMEKNPARGYFVDQRYLDLLPVYFPPVNVLRHPGCNVAYWNRRSLPRVKVGEEVLIRGEWPIVFIHFTASLMHEILDTGREALLRPFLDRYFETIRRFNPAYQPPQINPSPSGIWQKIRQSFQPR